MRKLAVMAAAAGLFALTAAPAHAATIGPDAFGYTATDEVDFSFVDISGTGTSLLGGFDDVTTGLVGMGFNFDFYGTTYSSVSWSPNGLMTFTDDNGQFGNVDLTTTAPDGDNPSIAPLWDDWQFFQSGTDSTYYQTLGAPGSQQFVVQWEEARGFSSSPSGVTFQSILYEGSNDILFQYLDVDSGDFRAAGADATVGIRDTNGHNNGEALQWSNDSAVIRGNYAIRFSPNQEPPAPVIPEPGTLGLMGMGLVGLGLRRKRS